MVKILHVADIHLDSPFSLLDPQKAQARKQELRGAFSSLVMYAKTENIDIVIIAGDLFDSGFVTEETMKIVVNQFASCPNCRFVIAPGNHDYYSLESPYSRTKFPSNVYIFESEKVSCFSFDDLGVDVYGYAFTGEKMTTNPLEKTILTNKKRINILACHTDLEQRLYCPVSINDIARSGFDYVAMGHIHLSEGVKKVDNTYYAYSGCLEGRSFDECGKKGAILVDIDFANGVKNIYCKQRKFCIKHYEKIKVDVSEAISKNEVITKIKKVITENGCGRDTLARIRLYGNVPIDIDLGIDSITCDDLGLYYSEIKDNTTPIIDSESLKNDITIKGAFYKELIPLLQSDDADLRAKAKLALKYGMNALSGNDLVDFEG